jgi:hypothetical protein
MRVLVSGGRDHTDRAELYAELDRRGKISRDLLRDL